MNKKVETKSQKDGFEIIKCPNEKEDEGIECVNCRICSGYCEVDSIFCNKCNAWYHYNCENIVDNPGLCSFDFICTFCKSKPCLIYDYDLSQKPIGIAFSTGKTSGDNKDIGIWFMNKFESVVFPEDYNWKFMFMDTSIGSSSKYNINFWEKEELKILNQKSYLKHSDEIEKTSFKRIIGNFFKKEDREVGEKVKARFENPIVKRIRYSVDDKRKHVSNIIELKKNNLHHRGVVSEYSKKYKINKRNLDRWIGKKHLQPGFEIKKKEPTKYRYSEKKLGRKRKYPEIVSKSVLEFVEKKNVDTAFNIGICNDDIKDHVQEKFKIKMKGYEISRIKKGLGLVTRKKTSKSLKKIKKEDIDEHEKNISNIRSFPLCILLNCDEKPQPKLNLPTTTITKKNTKNVFFNDGGRSAKASQTLVVGIYCICQYGNITGYGKSGLGVLLKGGNSGLTIPRAWKNRLTNYCADDRIGMKELYVAQTKKGVIKGSIFPEFMNHNLNRLKVDVIEKLNVSDVEYNKIPKFLFIDNAPGHYDAQDNFDCQDFFSRMKREQNLDLLYLPANSSDRTQPCDLGVMKEIKKLYIYL